MDNKNLIEEFSAGAVVFRKEQENILFLLIYSARNKAWGFPKGHIDQNESENEAAKRETKEETGLDDLVFIPGFRIEDVYHAVSNRGASKGKAIEKHTTYFLCQTSKMTIVVDAEEISDYRWVNLDEAVSLLNFESLKSLIKQSYSYIAERA